MSATNSPVPMAGAVRLLADLCARLDEGEEPTAAMVTVFNAAKGELAHGVDLTIDFLNNLEALGDDAAAKRDAYAKRAQRLRAAHKRLEELTKATVQENPGLPFAGRLGRLAVQPNGQAKLKMIFGDKEITPDVIDQFGIEQRFLTVETIYEINTKAVKDALKAGETLRWAELEHGTQLRVRPS